LFGAPSGTRTRAH